MSALHVAAALGDVETVRQSDDASMDARDPLLLKTPLHLAIEAMIGESVRPLSLAR